MAFAGNRALKAATPTYVVLCTCIDQGIYRSPRNPHKVSTPTYLGRYPVKYSVAFELSFTAWTTLIMTNAVTAPQSYAA